MNLSSVLYFLKNGTIFIIQNIFYYIFSLMFETQMLYILVFLNVTNRFEIMKQK